MIRKTTCLISLFLHFSYNICSEKSVLSLEEHVLSVIVREMVHNKNEALLKSCDNLPPILLSKVKTKLSEPLYFNSMWKDNDKSLDSNTERVDSLSWHPHGDYIVSENIGNSLKKWNVKTGTSDTITPGHAWYVLSVAYSPDGKFIASGDKDGAIKVWDCTKDTCSQTLNGHSDHVNSVAWNFNGKLIASGSDDKTMRIWDAETGTCKQMKSYDQPVTTVSWSFSKNLIAAGSMNGTVNIWDADTGICRLSITGSGKSVNIVAWNPRKNLIASASSDEAINIWDADTGICKQTLVGHDGPVNTVSWSPEGRFIASGSNDKTVRLWDALTGQCKQVFEGSNTYWITTVAWSPTGECIAYGSDRKIKLRDFSHIIHGLQGLSLRQLVNVYNCVQQFDQEQFPKCKTELLKKYKNLFKQEFPQQCKELLRETR